MPNNSSDNNGNRESLQGTGKKVGFSFFKYGYRGGKEANFRVGKFQLRIATHQFAFWNNYKPVINLLF